MLTLVEKVLFIVAAAASLYLGYLGFRKVYLVIRRGGPDAGDKNVVKRTLEAAWNWIALAPTWRVRFWPDVFHAMIAWGFMFYFLVNFGDVLQGYLPHFAFLGQGVIGTVYRFLADIFSVSVITGMLYFLIRRFIYRSKALTYRSNVFLLPKVAAGGIRRDSLIVGGFILLHVGFRFIGETFALAQAGTTGEIVGFQPFAGLVSMLWRGMTPGALDVARHAAWWIALGLILAFVPYFPYTKHFHLIMSGINFLTRPVRTSLGTLQPINFEDESLEQMGAARVEQLPWKNILDGYACIMCNRCQDVCPAYLTGKELSPSALEVNKRYYLNDHLTMLAAGQPAPDSLIDCCTSVSALWACTACGACVEVCPVGNEPMFDLLYMRRNEVLMESAFPRQLQAAFKGMERNGNPWNLSKRERMAWTKSLEVEGIHIPTVDEKPDFEILWWVGCAAAYDARAQATARAFAKVLTHAGVNFAVLGELEQCTGDSARRAGNEALYYQLASANVEVLNEVKPPRIVVTCPHCYHTLGKEYYQFGGNYNVVHHTQLIAELIADGRLDPLHGSDGKLTYHDPCYLGRMNGIYDAPRSVLQNLDGNFVEMASSRNLSFCCGAGGAQMWKEEEHGSATVYNTRYEQATATGASTIAVACPFCLTMLTDASKQADQGVVVKDIVELIAERIV